MNFNRNNLDREPSPYLRQHQNSPIFWQPWNSKTLKYAKDHQKLVLVSIGYSTCHWCHLMANDTFNNLDVANFLNEHFVSIQIDKEQRPDIDAYFMEFINRVLGRGGWPLNVILTPDLNPIFAGTYFPSLSEFSLPGFKEILEQILWWYQNNKTNVGEFHPYNDIKELVIEDERVVIEPIMELFDSQYGGFGQQTKFPPYNTLLFLFSYIENNHNNQKIKTIIKKTLDLMQLRGLHDHLQGGFFRYTADRGWAIPHFEKMLYDQAMMLWVYSIGYKVFQDSSYQETVQKIIKCLTETFENDGSYYSGFDAGGEGDNGSYYLWSVSELEKHLTKKETDIFFYNFELYSTESLQGKNHLVKKQNSTHADLEDKLLRIRKLREQPFVDKKIITSWNALTAIALFFAYRFVGIKIAKNKAIEIYKNIFQKNFNGNQLSHSTFDGKKQPDVFIADYAALLLLATYIYEETKSNIDDISMLYQNLQKFKINNLWYKNTLTDNFHIIPGESLDYPIPSDVSLAEFAQFRAQLILGIEDSNQVNYKVPLQNDFYNLYAYLKKGNYHQISTPDSLDWNLLPINSIQIPNHKLEDSFHFKTKKFQTKGQLVAYFKNITPAQS